MAKCQLKGVRDGTRDIAEDTNQRQEKGLADHEEQVDAQG
jgi:hypothetical protein